METNLDREKKCIKSKSEPDIAEEKRASVKELVEILYKKMPTNLGREKKCIKTKSEADIAEKERKFQEKYASVKELELTLSNDATLSIDGKIIKVKDLPTSRYPYIKVRDEETGREYLIDTNDVRNNILFELDETHQLYHNIKIMQEHFYFN